MHLAITAARLRDQEHPARREPPPRNPITVHLNIAPQVDSVRVAGSAIDVPLSEQGSSITIVPREEIAERNEGLAVDLLRYLPGITVGQTGSPGGVADVFIRGGNYNFNLVQIDGVPVNSFGGAFDFAHIPTDWLERVEVIEGPQSAVYGAYANSGVVNFVTRSAEDSPHLDVLAEGGTYQEHRFAIGASGTLAGFGVAAFASQLGDNGPVSNSDYRNDNVALHITRSFGRQSLVASAATSMPTWSARPALTVPIRGTISRVSISSPATRTTSPITSCITRSMSRRDFARRLSPVSSWRTAATPARTDSAIEKDLRGQFETRSDGQRDALVHGGLRRQPGARGSQEHLHQRR